MPSTVFLFVLPGAIVVANIFDSMRGRRITGALVVSLIVAAIGAASARGSWVDRCFADVTVVMIVSSVRPGTSGL